MGFDWFICIHTHIDETTGLPVVGWFDKKKEYVPEEVQVPEKYRRFLRMRGSIFHAYTDPIEEESNVTGCPAADMLAVFPSWEDVQGEYTVEDYDWTEADHTLLKEALEWFSSKDCFYVEWC